MYGWLSSTQSEESAAATTGGITKTRFLWPTHAIRSRGVSDLSLQEPSDGSDSVAHTVPRRRTGVEMRLKLHR